MADKKLLYAPLVNNIQQKNQVAEIVNLYYKQPIQEQKYTLNTNFILNDKLGIINAGFVNKSPKISFDSYKTADTQFGVVGHIDKSNQQLVAATNWIRELRKNFFLEKNQDKEDSLIKKTKDFIESLYSSSIYSTMELDIYFGDIRNWDRFVPERLSQPLKLGTKTKLPDPADPAKEIEYTVSDQSALFSTGDVMRKDIRLVDGLRNALARFYNYQKKILLEKKSQLIDIENEIPTAHQHLENLNQQRLRSLADYQVARLLVAENWADVEKAYAERARILNNHKGLYYARVRETPVDIPPINPLPLRPGSLDDLVPGAPLEDADLPEELQVFMESVLDIPMSDWASLHEHYKLLPTRHHLQRLLGARQARLDYRAKHSDVIGTHMIGVRLNNIRYQNQMVVRDLLNKAFAPAQSLVDYQRSAAQLLSLEDLLNGPPHRLRGFAELQRNKLDQATHALLKELRKVTPSIRLQWSEAAEQDTLDVLQPARWPALAQAEAKDLNGIRTLVELVQWWSRQLTENAGSTSHSAVRNLIRAALMISAADDPDQIIHGQLKTVPGEFKLGKSLRLTLNREALPGTLLQLVDKSNVLIGTLRVDDVDDKGTVATITRLQTTSITPSTQFTVTGFTLPGKKR